jgi:hypothetical protein
MGLALLTAFFSRLLKHLNCHTIYGGNCLSHIAQHDHLFLQHNVQSLVKKKQIRDISHIVDLTTLLLHRLYYYAPKGLARKRRSGMESGIKMEKFIANLEHLLRCLQQAALDALVYYIVEVLGNKVKTDFHWQPRKPKDADWFMEWPNGRRPLSTTWPWNIKPSLVVLWGVCWMFYDNDPTSNRPRQSLDRQGNWQGPSFFSSNLQSGSRKCSTASVALLPLPFINAASDETSAPIPEYYSGNPAWRSSQPGHVHGATNPNPNDLSDFIGQTGVGASASGTTRG